MCTSDRPSEPALASLAAGRRREASCLRPPGEPIYENRAAAGEDVVVDVPMPTAPTPLRVRPFHALEVQPALTFTYGGLRIDADARVLDRDNRPIAGLHAAGADAGGVFHAGYEGGLGMSLVLGQRAARTAMAGMRARRDAAPPSR